MYLKFLGHVFLWALVLVDRWANTNQTNPLDSPPGSIRGDYCIDVGKNIVHGSDSVESAEREIKLWFPNGVANWTRGSNSLYYE
jgi:nucleoside-diphosphate kinase